MDKVLVSHVWMQMPWIRCSCLTHQLLCARREELKQLLKLTERLKSEQRLLQFLSAQVLYLLLLMGAMLLLMEAMLFM